MKKEDPYFWEEAFHGQDRKKYRKEKKLASKLDRSKYKKTDQKKKQPYFPPSSSQRGRVISISTEAIWVQVEEKTYACTLKGALKKEKTHQKNKVCVGDLVQMVPLASSQGQIIAIEDRFSILARMDPIQKKQQLIAVNVDQVLITMSVVLPPLKPLLLDRYLIATYQGNMKPVLVINKVDLLFSSPSEKALLQQLFTAYQNLNIPMFLVSCETKEGLSELKEQMSGKTSVFSGQSGVGKSSLINLLLSTTLPVGEITFKNYRGKHTTTQAKLLPIEGGGFCIDTPGIKSFGIWNLHKEEVQQYFPEIYSLRSECKFPGCLHGKEPGCAVQKAVKEGLISSLRFASYQNILLETLENKDLYYYGKSL